MKQVYKRLIFSIGIIGLVHLTSCDKKVDKITIDLATEGAEIPSSLYGIFFEEITHSGDGGLYAEMIQNRGFEDGTPPSGTTLKDGFAVAESLMCYSNDSINNFRVQWDDNLAMKAWTVQSTDGSEAIYKIVTDQPLNQATPHSLYLNLSKSSSDVQVINDGYWNIAVTQGKQYNLTFHLRTDNQYGKAVEASLIDESGKKISSINFDVVKNNRWNAYNGTFVPSQTGNKYRLMLSFANKGNAWLDYVSLFPEETYNSRPNGLRKDVAEMLADLQPDFIRWPGGCIVEGLTMENRVKWKETIGNPVTRPGEYNLWGYRSTYGFGYHEFLQYCEDINAYGMFVCNAGMSCLFRNGDFYPEDKINGLITEALDAIEYAIGDTTTVWGKERTRNGHPSPFPLKYVEIGNENIGIRYAQNYNRFYKAIKEKYPEIIPICALMFSPNLKDAHPIDIIDPHYYETADWFYNNADVYDKLPENYPYKVYVGEYAAVGKTSLYSSLAEAAYLTGVERNADKVQLVSYAPLLQNAAHGQNHLIILKNDSVFGRTNYYVLNMFSKNRPDVNLQTTIDYAVPTTSFQPEGLIGLGTSGTSVEYKDFKISGSNQTGYSTDWNDFSDAWSIQQGSWSVKDNILIQPESRDGIIWLDNKKFDNCTIELKARKTDGREGFRVLFGGRSNQEYFMADIGSHTNESVIFREINKEGSVSLFDYRNSVSIETNRWYDIKVEIKGNSWKCYLDNELQYEYTYKPTIRHYTVSGYDKENKEVVIKMVNGESTAWNTQVNLKNVKSLHSEAKRITLSSPSGDDENSFANPEMIIPIEESIHINGPVFDLVCEPNSLVILRIRCDQ